MRKAFLLLLCWWRGRMKVPQWQCTKFIKWIPYLNTLNNLFFLILFLLLTLLQMSPFPALPTFTQLLSPRPSPHCCLCLWVLHVCSVANPFIFHLISPPLWQLSACSMYTCLFLACSSDYFSLFIRFHI